MKMKKWICFGGCLVMISLVAPAAHAHLRNYLVTYGYETLEKGKLELAQWTDYHNPKEGSDYWSGQTEVEYGVTNRLTMGVYGTYQEDVGYTATKLEGRYRLAEQGQWPVDTTLYLEYKDANGAKSNDEVEGKFIFSKDVNRWNFASNVIIAYEKETEDTGQTEWELEKGLTLATSYRTTAKISPSLELTLQENKSTAIPQFYWDITPDLRFNLGVALGLEPQADTAVVKSILEFEF